MEQKDIHRAASLLGSLNRGRKKILTDEEKHKRSLRLAEARKKRWSSARKKKIS
jgi:hypothetical protein